jgi:hypothetical protein
MKESKYKQVFKDVDDEIYLLMKRIQFKHDLTWAKARDYVNKSILNMYEQTWFDDLPKPKKCHKCNIRLNKKNTAGYGLDPKRYVIEGWCVKCFDKNQRKK